MENIIIILLLVVAVGGAVYYICKKKKAGSKCIGCPCSNTCCGATGRIEHKGKTCK